MLSGRARRVVGLGLLGVGVVALALSPPREGHTNAWAIVFMISSSVGFWLVASNASFRWVLAGLPWWVHANASSLVMTIALTLTIGGLAVGAVGPVLPGRRRRHPGQPLPHLANGPLAPVAARTFSSGRRSRVMDVLAVVLGVTAISLFLAAPVMRDPWTPVALGISATIMSLTFLFSNWYSTRVSLRVDDAGLHTRVLLREHTLAWRDVSAVSLRYVFMGMGLRLVYYCVHSPAREVAFPSSLTGAPELRATIEAATGLSWPEPDITPNF